MLADPFARRRVLPPNERWETLSINGRSVRSVRWPGARGSILFVGGRADFIEKYSEAYWTWIDAGFGVATFDWPGQGRSGRLGRHARAGHGDFDRWTDDLAEIAAWFARTMPAPHHIVAHSMGGHLTLRYLARGGAVERGVLLAPMLGIGIVRSPLVRRMADAAARFGLGSRFALLQRDYGAWQQRPERQALLTGCPERFADEHWWIASDPELALGGVTYGWLSSAYASIDGLFAKGVLERIATPLLVLVGEHERLVDPAAMQAAVVRLPDCRFEVVPDGRHELLRDIEPVQADVHRRIAGFLAGSAS